MYYNKSVHKITIKKNSIHRNENFYVLKEATATMACMFLKYCAMCMFK